MELVPNTATDEMVSQRRARPGRPIYWEAFRGDCLHRSMPGMGFAMDQVASPDMLDLVRMLNHMGRNGEVSV